MKILYICVVAIVMVIAFGGGLSLSRVSWKSAYSRSNMKPKSIPKQARKWIEQLFCRFQVLRQHFMFLSFSFYVPFIGTHVHSFSFHIPFIFLSYSFHVHSNVHSCPLIFLSFARMFLSFCIHVLSFPFYSYGNGSMAWPGN